MTFWRLIGRNLAYYWRTNLAVLVGVVAATAVIGGALIVGDSVRDSLTQMSLDRLGNIHHAMVSPRFVREDLALSLQQSLGPQDQTTSSSKSPVSAPVVAPAILLSTTVEFENDEGRTLRAGRVQLFGLDDRLWELTSHGEIAVPVDNEAVINQKLAEQIGANVDDEISLLIEIPASIPRDSLLGDRDQTVTELLVKVRAIAPDELGLSRLGLNPSQQLPSNVYVSLKTVQQQLGLSEVRATQRNPIAKPARVNAMFCGSWTPEQQSLSRSIQSEQSASATSNSTNSTSVDGTPVNVEIDAAVRLSEKLHAVTSLEDLGLKVGHRESGDYLAIESEQMILDNFTAEVVEEIASQRQLPKSPVLVYLLNRIGTPVPDMTTGKLHQYSMYSVAAGIDFSAQNQFGALDFIAGSAPSEQSEAPAKETRDIPIVINEWLADDLKGGADDGELVEIGAQIPLTYHVVGDRGDLPEAEVTAVVVGIVRMTGGAIDRGLTPNVPGVTDVESYGDWREPFPLDHDAITQRDEDYWKQYKATPKILMRLDDAQQLWKSRYGGLTSFRVAAHSPSNTEGLLKPIGDELLNRLTPEKTGLLFQPVREIGIQAASGTTDFSGLFLGFSMFLIGAATLLIGILFRLGIERRVTELGLYGALGLAPSQVRRLFLCEGAIVCVAGGLLGIPAAIGYAELMVYGLRTWWIGAIGTRFLFVSLHGASLTIGALLAILVAMGGIGWALWQLRKLSHRQLMSGVTVDPLTLSGQQRQRRFARWLAYGSGAIAAMLLGLSVFGLVPSSEAFGGFSWQIVAFFITGFATLTGCLALFANWLDVDSTSVESSSRSKSSRSSGDGVDSVVESSTRMPPVSRLSQLSVRNAGRQRGRSVMTACLIAFASFVIVAVAAGRRNPTAETPTRRSGNGGFAIVAESSLPTLFDPASIEGQVKLGFTSLPEADQKQLEQLQYFRFRARFGEDASCLNLYETALPTILGVPDDVLERLISEQRFRFADARGTNPWTALQSDVDPLRVPVLGDLNTLTYSLKKGIGKTISLPEHILTQTGLTGTELEVAGMFDSSIFQGVLVMSERNFQRLFPDQVGFRYFLVDTSAVGETRADTERVLGILESALVNVGLDAEPVADRLASYLSVQNTYLSTFQTLGGLGLLLGTLGLATVMLRNVLDRRSELALFRAIGFANRRVGSMVALENAVVLLVGLAIGTLSALLAMTPHLLSTGADTPWQGLLVLLVAVVAIGMTAPLLAIREAVHAPILQSLRGE